MTPGSPASAKVYDWLAGGHDNSPADAALGAELERIYPGLRRLVARNREYLAHATLMAQ
ncbi:MAG: SAM-dependent methyltransferase [Streptosporangiaceae bacterium]